MRQGMKVCGLLAPLVLWGVSGTWAEGGVVRLQTADPSCPDDSGNRYVDCGNGTVTDNETGLVWLANANCLSGYLNGEVDWFTAMEFAGGLSDKPDTSAAANQDCGLSDGSSPGEWRLPSIEEWEAMVADAVVLGCTSVGFGGPSITNDSGAQCWQEGPGNSFTGVQSAFYWSSSSYVPNPSNAWSVNMSNGNGILVFKSNTSYVWPVRGGQ